MTVSSPLAPPSWMPLELSRPTLALLDPACSDYLLYPEPARWHRFSNSNSAHDCSPPARTSSHAASLTLTLVGTGEADNQAYQQALLIEIGLLGRQFGKAFLIDQLHLCGHSLPPAQLAALLTAVQHHFSLHSHCDFVLQLPLTPLLAKELHCWAAQGFRHLHLSVQAGDIGHLKSALTVARALKFESIRIKLCFGLPQQSLLTLARSINAVIAIAPDQVALSQTQPDHEQLCWCLKRLNQAGYYYLGGYFFSKAQDPLVRAQRHGRLHRDLYGYTTHNNHHHLGCGLGGISSLGNYYQQNSSDLNQYCADLNHGTQPLARSLSLSMDDLLRRIVIQLLICQFEISIQTLELSYPIKFQHYFARELSQLQTLAQRGWLLIEPGLLQILPNGQLFIFQICSVFDRYRCADTTLS